MTLHPPSYALRLQCGLVVATIQLVLYNLVLAGQMQSLRLFKFYVWCTGRIAAYVYHSLNKYIAWPPGQRARTVGAPQLPLHFCVLCSKYVCGGTLDCMSCCILGAAGELFCLLIGRRARLMAKQLLWQCQQYV